MAKNKKKSYLVTPVGSTATSRKKQNPKVEKAAKVIGTVAALTPIGRSAKVASAAGRAVSKVANRMSAKESREVGMRAAREVAENTKPGRLGSAGNQPFTKRTNPKKPVTARDAGGKQKSSTYGASTVEGRTAKRTFEQRLGSQKAGDTKRAKRVAQAGSAAERAAKPVVAKAKAKTAVKTAAVTAPVAYGIGEYDRKNKGKNKKRR
jgi:hypothetical protein